MAVACALAFKQGKHNEAVRLMYKLDHPEDVVTVLGPVRVEGQTLMRSATVSLVHLAAYHGWLDVLKYQRLKLLCDGKDSVGRTPLHYAAVGGSLPVVQYLITEQHCDPATPGQNNNTPLHYACIGGHTSIVKYLINEQKCNPTCENKNKWTPLHYACKSGHKNIVQYLITELGCDPIVSDINGTILLHFACLNGHLDITKYLINEQNCDPMCENEDKWTPLHYACKGGHKNIVQYLITELGCDPIVPNIAGCLPLHIACRCGHLDLIKYLITEQNCDPMCEDKNKSTPLHYACQGGHKNIVHYLISKLGCDPIVPNIAGSLPLHIACRHGHLDLIKYLITEQNCDPMCENKYKLTPLHYACQGGHMNIVHCLIVELGCDPKTFTSFGSLPLHIACKNGHLDFTKYLITEQNCDPMCEDNDKWTPLHYACAGGHMNIVQYLVAEVGCDPLTSDKHGNLPLHIACAKGHLNLTRYLLAEQNCDPSSFNGGNWEPLYHAYQSGFVKIATTNDSPYDPKSLNNYSCLPLNIACRYGYLNLTRYLVTELKYDPMFQDKRKWTSLHHACEGGHMKIVKYLLVERGCDSKTPDIDGNLPLHIACRTGHLSLTTYLINEHNCDPNIPDGDGRLLIHISCLHGHLNVIKYLITDRKCDPNCRNRHGLTPLQYALAGDHINIIKYLIAQIKCTSTLQTTLTHELLKTKFQAEELAKIYTPRHIWSPYNAFLIVLSRSYHVETLNMILTLQIMKNHFPIHSFNKVLLTGNSNAGKTTLAKVITERATSYFNWLKFGNVQQVNNHTAGIVPSHIQSREVGNIVLYDLAGHAEYHSSHSAVMETVLQQSPAIFINLIKLVNTDAEITQQFHYWLNFIDNAIGRTDARSCLIIVGSHADLLSKEMHDKKVSLIANLVQMGVNRLDYMGFVSMDCRRINSGSTNEFISLLFESQKAIAERVFSITHACYSLYAFLQVKKIAYCQLQELGAALAADQTFLLPSDMQELTRLLNSLSDKGIIFYLQNEQHLERSWIVTDTEGLLEKVMGVLFAPKTFQEHCEFASNTGIVHMSSFKCLFPDYDLEMLVGFLENLELYHRVNLSGISTNLRSRITHLPINHSEEYLFFPSLLEIQRPRFYVEEDLSVSFGWCLSCKNQGHQFFNSRFLHVLILCLAYTYPLADNRPFAYHERSCTVWKNGITWDNVDGIRTVVELTDQNQCVVIGMSYRIETRQLDYIKHRSAVIKLVLDLKQQLCPHIHTCEYLINQSSLKQWPAEEIHLTDDDVQLFSIEKVSESMLNHYHYILNNLSRSTKLSTKQILEQEPYYRLSCSFVCDLMDSSKADDSVPLTLLHEVKTCYRQVQVKPQSYSSLRNFLDEMSLFAGRNPIELAGLDAMLLRERDYQHDFSSDELVATADLSSLPEGPFDLNHLPQLVIALCEVVEWFDLGIQLGVHHSTLSEINIEQQKVEGRRREMLVKWLKGSSECTKLSLRTALRKIKCNVTDVPQTTTLPQSNSQSSPAHNPVHSRQSSQALSTVHRPQSSHALTTVHRPQCGSYLNLNRMISRWSWHNMQRRILWVFKYVRIRTVYSFLSFLPFLIHDFTTAASCLHLLTREL